MSEAAGTLPNMQSRAFVRSSAIDYYASGIETAVVLAARWSARQASELGEQVDVWVPRSEVPQDVEEVRWLVRALHAEVRSPRARRRQPPRRRVTVAVCPHMEDIADLDQSYSGQHALCVLSITEFESRAWRLRTNAEVLDARPEYLNPPDWDLAPTVAAALAQVMHIPDYNALAGQDGQRAGAALKALHRAGYQLPPRDILGFALQAGWRLAAARTLADLADRAGRGVDLRVGSRPAFGVDDVRRWRTEAGEKVTIPQPVLSRSRQW